MFSPLAFPQGLILYDLSSSLPPPSHLALAPFELFREPLVVLGIADGRNIAEQGTLRNHEVLQEAELNPKNGQDASIEYCRERLVERLDNLINDFPRSLVHHILVFDHDTFSLPEGITPVASLKKSRTTTIKTVMCDLTSCLLAEMTTYAKSLQGLSSLESPKVLSGSNNPNRAPSALPDHIGGLSRSGSVFERSRSFSPAGDRSRSLIRSSLPARMTSRQASRTSTPESRTTSPPNSEQTPPKTLVGKGEDAAARSPPKKSSHDRPRADSQEKVSTSGFGAGSLGERERNKGKGRVGVVVGAMYLMAGRWPDALKELVNSVTVARASSDYLWHAKGLDYILVCLLMYAWAGLEFRVSLQQINECIPHVQYSAS